MGLFSGERPSYLGVKDGRLAPCKTTPNCVSSYGDKVNDPGHYVEPLRPNGDPAAAFAQLTAIVRDTERVTVMKSEPRYLYAEFKTRIMGFVDDVEFLLDEHDRVIHVRSASRIGRSDFGVNRARIESLRAALGAASA